MASISNVILLTLNEFLSIYPSIIQMKRERSPKQLNIKIPNQELNILNGFSEHFERTKTDIIREFIRSLESESLESHNHH